MIKYQNLYQDIDKVVTPFFLSIIKYKGDHGDKSKYCPSLIKIDLKKITSVPQILQKVDVIHIMKHV